MKKVLFATTALILSATFASALTVDTGKGTANAVISEGVAYAIPLGKICGMKTMKVGPARYDVGREGKYVTIGGLTTRITCSNKIGGAGSGPASGGESLNDSQARSGETNPGETTGGDTQQGTNDDGSDAGFGSISG